MIEYSCVIGMSFRGDVEPVMEWKRMLDLMRCLDTLFWRDVRCELAHVMEWVGCHHALLFKHTLF